MVYTPVKSGGGYLDESDGDGSAQNSGPNTNSGVDRTVTLTFAVVDGVSTAMFSVATMDDGSDTDGGLITLTLKADPADTDTYTVNPNPGASMATVSVIKAPVPELTIATASTMVSTDEGTAAMIMVEASESPKRPLTFKYTPSESGNTEYLAPVDEDGTMKGSGDERTVTLEFAETPPGSDTWIAILSLATQEDEEPGGTIEVVLVDGTGYTVGGAKTSTVTVDDVSIPELSVADADETLAGSDAMFVVTSSIPFVGDLAVVYNPVKSDGNYLNETDGDGTALNSGPNTNSALDREVTITFAEDSGAYTAILRFATVDDDMQIPMVVQLPLHFKMIHR